MIRIVCAVAIALFSATLFGAQVNEDTQIRADKRILRASNTALSVPAAGNTTLLELDVKDIDRVYVQVAPTTNGFDVFRIDILAHSNAAYTTIASAAGDYTAPTGLLVGVSGDLTTLAAAATGWFIIDTRGLARVRVQASGSGGASTVSIYAGGY